jgi:hypothetical protein
LSWQATGTARLVPSPVTACEGSVDPRGSRACVVERDTLFRLQVQRGGSAMRAEQEIEVVAREGREIAIGERTECAGDCVVAIANLPAEDWDPAVQVDTVVADPSRRISIVHAGRVAVLGPGVTTTDVFRGTPTSGKWVLASPVAAAETCAAPAHAPRVRRPPDALGITVRVRCGN